MTPRTVTCPAFVICRRVSSGRDGITLHQVSDTIPCRGYPTELTTACLLSLTGGRGQHEVSVWLTLSPVEETRVFSRTAGIDPVRVTNFVFSFSYPVREPGVLFLTAKVDGRTVADRRMRVYEPYD